LTILQAPRSLAHWHTPVETYFVLSGTGVGRIGDATLPIGPGAAVYVPSRTVHWFENTGDEPLHVLWTLNCDGLDDIDFTFVD
jgi:mannose-6-phosphate isomerase-like protein (cupin superfamily)